MTKTSYPRILARSALISVFLATSALAQTSFGQPQQQIYISIVNVSAGDGRYVPALWVEDAFGHRTQVMMDQDGLTRAILYDKEDLIAWVLERFGKVENPKVFYDDRTGDEDTQNPAPNEEPEEDCDKQVGANATSINDLPIVLVGSDPCVAVENDCPTAFHGTNPLQFLQQVDLAIEIVPEIAIPEKQLSPCGEIF